MDLAVDLALAGVEGVPFLRGYNGLRESGAIAHPYIILGNPAHCPTSLFAPMRRMPAATEAENIPDMGPHDLAGIAARYHLRGG